MSIELQIKYVAFDQSREDNIDVQYIPAGVSENVPADVDEFFNKYTHEENGGMNILFFFFFLRLLATGLVFISIFLHSSVLKNSLRGYPLDGCRMKVPKEYQGVVYQETQRPMLEDTKRWFRTKGIFSEFTYWNYDKEPSNNDALKQAFVWNDLANVVSYTQNTYSICI